MAASQDLASIILLALFIVILRVEVPRARRNGEWFLVACSILTALVALLGWMLVGVGSR